MKKFQNLAAVILVLLVVLTAYGFWETRTPIAPVASSSTGKKGASQAAATQPLVDQSPLKTARQLAQLAASPEERVLAQEAVRLADYEVDLAFDTALREARLHPPALTAEAKEIQQRLQQAEKLLKTDQDKAKQLAEKAGKAPEGEREGLETDLVQAEADMDLDQDEVDDAKQDLIRAGGDLAGRIQTMKKEHEETAHGASTAVGTGPEAEEKVGLVHRVQQWNALHQEQMQLWTAKGASEAAVTKLAAQHKTLDAQLDVKKESLPELAHHSKRRKAGSEQKPAAGQTAAPADSATLLQKTEEIAADQKTLAAYDKRMETQKELAGVYGQWIDLVAAHQRSIVHRMLLGVLVIFVIALVGVFFSSWVDSLVARLSMDRRQIESLRTVTRVSSQIGALFLILLVIIGPPSQLGTFLGLAGAGLTVALKDFIVSFIGWFVLMGKNGMRLGDWVEINGVTGEVVQIGPFHTVLLETGNWTDSGHPTGRRVTFTNNFAIEGHYFNFSTTGQWLWDELRMVLPAGQDTYAMVDAINKKVLEATKESTQQAEREWHSAAHSREMGGTAMTPSISVKPVLGGVELSVRYITRANERYMLRSKLNQTAVELLGTKGGTISS